MSEQIAKFHADRDAYGHEITAYYQDPEGEHFEIVEREDGFISASPWIQYYFAGFPDWPECQRAAMADLVPGRALDLGCGAGRVTLYLQSLGYEVVGIDTSPLAVQICRERGVCDARLMSITQVSPKLGAFQNFLMLGNNWGLMANRARARRLLRIFHRMSGPGARIIAETNDIYATDNPIHLAYQAWNRERGRMSGQIRLRVRCGIYASTWFDYLMVSKDEMREILDGTGWRILRFHDRAEGSGYVAVIEREENT